MQKLFPILILCLALSGCSAGQTAPVATATQTQAAPPQTGATRASTPSAGPSSAVSATPISSPTAAPSDTPNRSGEIRNFDHIVLIVFENHSYSQVIGSSSAPYFNQLASLDVLFTDYHAVTHPSLPNYISLIGGSTLGIHSDCNTCYVNAPSLPDEIEASGRTWKAYMEDMPSPCFTGFYGNYDKQHDPFVYFDAIRNDAARCQKSVVPLTELTGDLANNQLPNFSFITPNLCNSGHNCSIRVADGWLRQVVSELQSSPALGDNSAIFIVFDEASSDDSSCCGLGPSAGGRVAAILVSPQAKSGFQDSTPLSHYSLLKTILASWNLPPLGMTADPATAPITAPWK